MWSNKMSTINIDQTYQLNKQIVELQSTLQLLQNQNKELEQKNIDLENELKQLSNLNNDKFNFTDNGDSITEFNALSLSRLQMAATNIYREYKKVLGKLNYYQEENEKNQENVVVSTLEESQEIEDLKKQLKTKDNIINELKSRISRADEEEVLESYCEIIVED